MNKTIKKSILILLIATMLIAPSITIMHAQETPPPVKVILPPGSQTVFEIIDWGSTPPILPIGGGGPTPPPPDIGPSIQVVTDGSVQLPALPGIIGNYYEVRVIGNTGGLLNGKAEVFVRYDPAHLTTEQQKHLRLFIGDPVDFNGDNAVNAIDILLMLKAIASRANDPRYDINHDGKVNVNDLLIVMQFATHGLIVNQGGGCFDQTRLPWMDITAGVDLVNHYVFGFTDHFSGFGVH